MKAQGCRAGQQPPTGELERRLNLRDKERRTRRDEQAKTITNWPNAA